MVTEDRSRGQVILIGAITLAFIILGVVVVFNGVLYTETVSSGTSSQSSSNADVTTSEVEQNVGCLLASLDKKGYDQSNEPEIEDALQDLGDRHRETNARSRPVITDITVDNIQFDASGQIEHATVTVAYDSNDLSYTRELEEIEPDDSCLNS